MIFPSDAQPAIVVDPGKEPLDFPSPLVSSQRTTILGDSVLSAASAVGRDHLDADLAKLCVESIAVVSLVADHALGQRGEVALFEGRHYESDFGWRSARCA